MRRFKPGETAVRQDVWHGSLWHAMPSVVVEDDGEVMVTHVAPGTVYKSQAQRPGHSIYGAPDDAGDNQRARIFATLRDPSPSLVDYVWEAKPKADALPHWSASQRVPVLARA